MPIIRILNSGSLFVTSTEATRACPEQGRRAERRGLLSKQISPLRPTYSGPSVEMTYVFLCNFTNNLDLRPKVLIYRNKPFHIRIS